MLKIALVHDWFNEAGGAEKVVKEILHCYPEADVFCLFDFFDQNNRDTYLHGKTSKTSFIQHIPFARRGYRNLFPLFPYAIESLDLKDYQVIISSSSCVAKGVKRQPGQLHISYCHSPARYAWDLKEDYLKVTNTGITKGILSYFFEKLRKWDFASCDRVDHFIANSSFVHDRIQRFFMRQSTVIYPPVNIGMKDQAGDRSESYITVSRLVTYKNIDLIVEAFRRMPELKLEIAGFGPMRRKIMKDLPPNVTYLGFIDEETKHRKMSRAKAFIAAATEDFGISVVEAQSYGTPVIVPFKGGYKETVNNDTGVFFNDQTPEDMVATIRAFHTGKRTFRYNDFEKNITRFSIERFRTEFKTFVDDKINRFFSERRKE
ncbi:MAG TPA: glycosyltransferase [Bacteroidales bacterium]|nr:glycosyltransferase [Bacteroidales bacterium]